jgi:steroid 5-alpha reductase family enzyme
MARSGRITLIALVLGVILFAAARKVFEYADVESIALVIAVISLVLAIVVDLLLAHFTETPDHEHGEAARRGHHRRRVGPRGKR